MVTANTISQLFFWLFTGDNTLDLEWNMIYNYNLKQELLPETSFKTSDMVIQNKTCSPIRILSSYADWTAEILSPCVPVFQKIDTIWQYHRELGILECEN